MSRLSGLNSIDCIASEVEPSNPLDGQYALFRASVIYPSGLIVDTEDDSVSATGTMVIDGNSISQTITVNIDGESMTVIAQGTFVDFGYFVQVRDEVGIRDSVLLERGNTIETLANVASMAEVDRWVLVNSVSDLARAESSNQRDTATSLTPNVAALGGLVSKALQE